MSWGEYITNLQGQGLKQAVIAGQDGSWIQSSDAAIQQADVKKFMANFGKTEVLAMSGIQLGPTKYMYISGDDSICRGKKGHGGMHASKSNTTVVIGIYDESMQPQQAATIVEKMSQYLKDAGCWEIMFVS